MSKNLDDLGIKYATDKSSAYHNYLVFYEKHLSKFLENKFTLFEFGVFDGASIRMWAEYFPNAQIVGIDYDEKSSDGYSKNVAIRRGDATDPRMIKSLIDEFGEPLVVIDDASHRWDHQIATLQLMLPFVRPGGCMIVEDLQTSFTPIGDQYSGHAKTTAVDYLFGLLRFVVANGSFNGLETASDFFFAQQGPSIASISFAPKTCIISKYGEAV